MSSRITLAIVVSLLAVAVRVHLFAQTRTADAKANPSGTWLERTSWGDPDFQGEWTSEGEFGVPFERPIQFGTRQFLTDEEYAARLETVKRREEHDLANVDVAGKVDDPNVPIPHWREYATNSRRTSIVIDPPDGRIPQRTPQAKPIPVQRCGSMQRGEPCDSYLDYNLHVRCIVQGEGIPDAMFPQVYNANLRFTQSPGFVAITYELIHETRVIPLDASPRPDPLLSPAIRMYKGASRGRWEGTTLVVETSNLKATTRSSSPALRLIERFTRTGKDSMEYEVTFIDPETWIKPWTAALTLQSRPDRAGVYEYECHEGNYGLRNMLSTSRHLDRQADQPESSPRP